MPLFKLTTSASNSMPMAVSDGEKRREDRRRTRNQIIEDWLDNYFPVHELQDKMKRKSDEIDEEESENSSQSKKLKGMKTSLKKPVLLRKCK
jgi:hypothetical protein